MSKVIFKKLVLDSFFSYDHEEIDLENQGVVFVKGINNSDSKLESNGSGKSALISDSIIWCLTGYTPRGASEVSNRLLDNGAMVELDFSIDDTEYKVIRGLAKSEVGNNIVIFKNGDNISARNLTDNVKLLEQELPTINWSQLTSIVVLSQGLVGNLSGLTNAERKNRVEELSGVAENFQLVQSLITRTNERISYEKSDIEKKLAEIDSSINTYEMMVADTQNKINAISAAEANRDAAIADAQSKLAEIVPSIAKYNADLEIADTAYRDASTLVSTMSDEVRVAQSSASDYKSEIDKILASKSQLELKISSCRDNLTSEKLHLSTITEGTCYACGQVLPGDKASELRAKAESSINDLISEIQKYTGEITQLDTRVEQLRPKYDEAQTKYTKLASDLAIKQAELTKKSSEISELKSTIRRLESEQSSLRSILDNKPSDITTYTNLIAELSDKIMNAKLERAKIEPKYNELSQKKSISDWYSSACTRSLRAFMLEKVVQYLSQKASEFSSYLFDKSRVSIEISGSKLEIKLGDARIENLSGGERRRVDLVVQLALRDLVLVSTGFYSNLLVIDEALDYLDSAGISAVIDLITTQKDTADTIYLITHKSDADISYDKVLLVEKQADGISRVMR